MEMEVRVITPIGVGPRLNPQILRLQVPDVCTVEDLLTRLNVSNDAAIVPLVNGRRCSRLTELASGDRVALMTPVAGG